MRKMKPGAELVEKFSTASDLQSLVGELSRHNDALLQEVRRLEVLCEHDPALDILNRRGLTRALQAEIARANRHGIFSSFIYFDIDKFKLINDLHGHDHGDHVLKSLTDHIQQRLRKTDSFARMGGDEFGIVLSHATNLQASEKAKDLAQSVSQVCKYWGPGAKNLSFSAGVTKISGSDTPQEIICRADKAMYANKNINMAY